MAEHCARCGSEVGSTEFSEPGFCPACGLPQLRMAEDAIAPDPATAAAPTNPYQQSVPASGTTLPSADWRLALRLIFVASVIGTLPALLLPGAAINGAVGGLVLVVTPLLSLGVVSLYYRSRRQLGMTGALGARMGATMGLLMGCWVALGTGIAGFALRYAKHSHALDDRITEATAKLPQQMAVDAATLANLTAYMQSPEFRASSFVLGHVVMMVVFTLVAAFCGWLAGAALYARRQRHIA